MTCRTARTAMIAARDGELGARGRRALDRHLTRCGSCRAERVSIEGVLAALDVLAHGDEVPARLEQNVMRRVRILAADEPASRGAASIAQWLRRLAPAVAAGAVAVVAFVGLRDMDERVPSAPVGQRVEVAAPAIAERAVVARRTKRVPDEPPAELASHPELFVDLPMLRNFEKVEHFDAIAGMEDDPTDDVPSPSNG